MKLIIWWLTLMFVLPLAFVFWWKKNWRLLIGVIIGVILLIGFFLPEELAYSIIKKKLDKEGEKSLKKLQTALNNISDSTINPSDSEKLKLEKNIKIYERQFSEYFKQGQEKELEAYLTLKKLLGYQSQWIKKYGSEENSRPFLFCGEEFNKGLSQKKWDLEHSTIDFGDSKNSNLEIFQKKLQQIHEQGEKAMRNAPYYFLVWLKNIDKITSPELKNELLKIVDPTKNADLGEYEKEVKSGQGTERIKIKIDFSKFILVATTSSFDSQLSSELSKKMNHIENFFDKHFLVIFLVSGGVEIITFYFLTAGKKKSETKPKKVLNKFYSVP